MPTTFSTMDGTFNMTSGMPSDYGNMTGMPSELLSVGDTISFEEMETMGVNEVLGSPIVTPMEEDSEDNASEETMGDGILDLGGGILD
jgi:hypothetical protein